MEAERFPTITVAEAISLNTLIPLGYFLIGLRKVDEIQEEMSRRFQGLLNHAVSEDEFRELWNEAEREAGPLLATAIAFCDRCPVKGRECSGFSQVDLVNERPFAVLNLSEEAKRKSRIIGGRNRRK